MRAATTTRWAAALGLLALAAAGCKGSSEPAPAGAEAAPAAAEADPAAAAAKARAQAALGPFKKQLMGALKAGMAESPTVAIDACNDKAPKIAAEAANAGVKVGRTTARLRNPANAPADWMTPLLAWAEAEKPPAGEGRVVRIDDGRWGYVEPIYMQGMCLTCHGAAVPSEVEAALKEHYPGDEARGYEDGQLRGLFWVEVAAAEGAGAGGQ